MADFDSIPLTSPSAEKAYPAGIAGNAARDSDGLHLYIDNPRVADLPKCGKITFYFERGPISLRESDGERAGSASVDLRLTEICDVEEEKEKDTPAKAADIIDEIFESVRNKPEAEADAEAE